MKRLSPFVAPTSPYPLGIKVASAQGSWIKDVSGKKYLDFISGIGVSSLGHGHPEIKEALHQQVDQHLHVMVYGEMEQNIQSEFAQNLCQQLPADLNCVYLVNSGTEANEAALKLVRRVTGRTELISCQKSYHGCTTGSLALSGNENKKYPFRPLLSGVKFMGFNTPQDLNLITENTAAVFIETIQGDAGIRIPNQEWMIALRDRCNKTGALLVMDEIQCGMGRTGKLFAFEHFGIQPDVLTLGKALGGGLPIGAVIANRKLLDQFASNPVLGHISTFAGHPLPCASGNAALKILLQNNLVQQAEKKGRLIAQQLKHQNIVELRWVGLFFGVQLASAEAVQKVVTYCLDKGLLVYWFLSCPDSFRLAPPLNISEADINWACQIIKEALDQI